MKQGRALYLSLIILALSVAAGASEEVAKEGTFEGDWALKGTARSIEVDGKEVALFRIGGPVKVRSSGGLATEFQALCIGVSDKQTGGVGRCVWTDDAGDMVFMELSGSIVGPMGTSREAEGTVIGGTGRYQGLEGSYHIDWLFVESHFDDSKFKGYVTKLEGSWKRP
jgi:hypothetical protein